MTQQTSFSNKKSPQKNTQRISITVPESELQVWKLSNNRESLSAFIRDAVNEYVKIQKPDNKTSLYDLFIEQKSQYRDIQQKLTRLERIEGDILDLSAAMAELDMIVPEVREGKIFWEKKK
jgi:hypothetical protein